MPKRIIFPKKGQVTLQEFDLPEMQASDVRVRTLYSIMSIGTETTILHQKYDPGTHFDKLFSFPQLKTGVLAVATIEHIGSDVTDFSPGDTVFMRMAHGSHQVIKAEDLSPVPGTIDKKDACWCGLAKTAFRGVWAAKLRFGASVLIIGAGPVGQLATRWASATGVDAIAVIDLSEKRQQLAAKGGATMALVGDIAENTNRIRAIDDHRGPAIVIDTTGNPTVLRSAFNVAARYGRIILLGDTGYPDQQHLTSDLMEKGLTLQATHDSHDRDGWTQQRVDEKFFQLVSSRRFNLNGLITHELAPEQCKEAYDLAEQQRGDTMGILFDWTNRSY